MYPFIFYISAFNRLINAHDSMSFKYWVNEALPEDVAYRYVCIPHIPGFWDHVLVGTRTPPNTVKMIGTDVYLPKLFNVYLGSNTFHWCCFVLKKQIILAMWCTSVPRRGQPKVLPLVDNTLRNLTSSTEFRKMVFYLCRWFTAQYVSPTERELNLVLDCKPSEGSTLVHFICLLASRCGMEKVTLEYSHHRAKHDTNYSFNLKNANNMLTSLSDGNTGGPYINIVDEFNSYHSETNCVGLTRIHTTTEFYSYL